ncbi:uncharacterized protein VTP21DRAFT_11003 [Calcarisporiella thermophila]|uniref:uncharacterized protein n=1 Tax=Calcarisporiella thermophila TaxID=911321 RepID=UPI003742D5A5
MSGGGWGPWATKETPWASVLVRVGTRATVEEVGKLGCDGVDETGMKPKPQTLLQGVLWHRLGAQRKKGIGFSLKFSDAILGWLTLAPCPALSPTPNRNARPIGLCDLLADLLLQQRDFLGKAILQELQQSKTRSAREQDRVYGICGLLSCRPSLVNYAGSVVNLTTKLHALSVERGDLSTCAYLGSDIMQGSGITTTGVKMAFEIHWIRLNGNDLIMDIAGITSIREAFFILSMGQLADWYKDFPSFLETTKSVHVDLAKAFQLPTETNADGLCPGAFAAYYGLLDNTGIIRLFGDDFDEQFQRLRPKAMLAWTSLAGATEDSALLCLWG